MKSNQTDLFNPEWLKRVLKTKGFVRDKDLIVHCPNSHNHSDGVDKHPSFAINLENLAFNCFSCRTGGIGIDSLEKLFNVKIDDYIKFLLLSKGDKDMWLNSRTRFVEELHYPYERRTKDAFHILEPRGVSQEAVFLTHTTVDDNGTLIFPIYTIDNRCIGWYGRNSTWDNRYAMLKGSKEHALFGIKAITGFPAKTLFLTEGTVDALKLISWGFDAVSTCGNRLYDSQVEQIELISSRIILVPQLDAGGRQWYKDCLFKLSGKVNLFFIITEGFKDIGEADMSKERFQKYKLRSVNE
jgi:DNA primase